MFIRIYPRRTFRAAQFHIVSLFRHLSTFFSSRRKEGKRSFSHWFDKSLYFSLKERFPTPFFDFVSYFSSRGKAGKRSFSHWFDKSLYFSLKERVSAPFLILYPTFLREEKRAKETSVIDLIKVYIFHQRSGFLLLFLILYPTFLREEKKAKETLVIGLSKVFKPPSLRKANTAFQSIQAQKPRTPGKQQQPDGFSVRLIFPAGCGNGGVGGLLQGTSDLYFPSGFFL